MRWERQVESMLGVKEFLRDVLDRQTASSGTTMCICNASHQHFERELPLAELRLMRLCFSHAPSNFALDYLGQAQLQLFDSSIVLLAPFSLRQFTGTAKSIARLGSSHLGLIIPCLSAPRRLIRRANRQAFAFEACYRRDLD